MLLVLLNFGHACRMIDIIAGKPAVIKMTRGTKSATQVTPINRSSTSASDTANVLGGVGAKARKGPGSKPAART